MDTKSCRPAPILLQERTNISTFRKVGVFVSWHYRGLLRANGSCSTPYKFLSLTGEWEGEGLRNVIRIVEDARVPSYLGCWQTTVKLASYIKTFALGYIYPKRFCSKGFQIFEFLNFRKIVRSEINFDSLKNENAGDKIRLCKKCESSIDTFSFIIYYTYAFCHLDLFFSPGIN